MAAAVKTPIALISKTLALTRLVSSIPSISQNLQLDDGPSPLPAPLPPNPSSGSPFYLQNWINPDPNPLPISNSSLVPIGGLFKMAPSPQTLDAASLMDEFAECMTSQRWLDLKQLFECWTRSLDANGKPNKPDVDLFNHYLRANLMMGTSAGELQDLVAAMVEYKIAPNAASYNLVLKAMHLAGESEAAENLIDR